MCEGSEVSSEAYKHLPINLSSPTAPPTIRNTYPSEKIEVVWNSQNSNNKKIAVFIYKGQRPPKKKGGDIIVFEEYLLAQQYFYFS